MVKSFPLNFMELAVLSPQNAGHLVLDPEALRHLATLVDWQRSNFEVWGLRKSSPDQNIFTLRGSKAPIDMVLSALAAARLEQIPFPSDGLHDASWRKAFATILDEELLDLVSRLHTQLRMSLAGVPYGGDILRDIDNVGEGLRRAGRASLALDGRHPLSDLAGLAAPEGADGWPSYLLIVTAGIATAIAGIALGGLGVTYMQREGASGGTARRKARSLSRGRGR